MEKIPNHTLKILPEFFDASFSGKKTFEIRVNDRDFKVGDIILLKEWDGEKYTGRQMAKRITYILQNAEQYGLMPGYCILSLEW